MTRLLLYLKWQRIHSDSLHAWAASLQHNWVPTCMLCSVSLSKAAIDSESIRSDQAGFCHKMRNREKAMVSFAFVDNNNVDARFTQPTRDSRSSYGGFSRGESCWLLSQSWYQGGSHCSFSGGESCAPGTEDVVSTDRRCPWTRLLRFALSEWLQPRGWERTSGNGLKQNS